MEPRRIAGTGVLWLSKNEDKRGSLVELYRDAWLPETSFVQWNVVTSSPRVLRGMHWHNRHWDFIGPVHGRLLVALADIRLGSPTALVSELIELAASEPGAVVIPPGVAHGFFSPNGSVTMYGVSHYWTPDDEFGVRYDDPALDIAWPLVPGGPILSERDMALPALDEAGERPHWGEATGAAGAIRPGT